MNLIVWITVVVALSSHIVSLDLGLYSAGNYRTGHLPRRGLVDFTSSQISPITLW
jgi:hypothetical protein